MNSSTRLPRANVRVPAQLEVSRSVRSAKKSSRKSRVSRRIPNTRSACLRAVLAGKHQWVRSRASGPLCRRKLRSLKKPPLSQLTQRYCTECWTLQTRGKRALIVFSTRCPSAHVKEEAPHRHFPLLVWNRKLSAPK